jgi:hypothetical protein
MSRTLLTGLLWGERSESQARASLRQTLSELRAALAPSASKAILATKEAVTWIAGRRGSMPGQRRLQKRQKTWMHFGTPLDCSPAS